MKWFRAQFRTFETAFVAWRDHLTLGGKTITCIVILGLTQLATLDSPLFLLCSAQLSLLLVTGTVGYWFRPRLSIRVLSPDAVQVGEAVELRVRIANQSPRPACDLLLDLVDVPESWEVIDVRRSVPLLNARASLHLQLRVRPTRRGIFKLPNVRATGSFPLNLFRFRREHVVLDEVVVLPAYRPLAAFESTRTASKYTGGTTVRGPESGSRWFASLPNPTRQQRLS
jgi:uncharacterized protein (DUF58 family)